MEIFYPWGCINTVMGRILDPIDGNFLPMGAYYRHYGQNFVVSGARQVEMFANAIEESYQESLTRPQTTTSVKYRDLHDPDEIKRFMEKWKKQNA